MKAEEIKIMSLEKYLNIIRPYLRDMINNHKTLGEWKIQLIMRINFVSSLDSNELRILHTKSDNIEIMSGIETNDIINELFKSFFKRYQEGLETKIKEVILYLKALIYYIIDFIK